jgi:hypothetical protein
MQTDKHNTINRTKAKKLIISIDVPKAFHKTHHLFMIKSPQNKKKGMKRTYFHIIRAIYYKRTACIILNEENLKCFFDNQERNKGINIYILIHRSSNNRFIGSLNQSTKIRNKRHLNRNRSGQIIPVYNGLII